MVKEELCEKVAEVSRVSDGVMIVVAALEEDVLWLIWLVDLCVSSTKWKFGGKIVLYDKLKCEWDMQYADNYNDDINGHVGRHIDGLDGVHGGHGVGQRY